MTYNVKQIPNYLGLYPWDQTRRLKELIDALDDFAGVDPQSASTTAAAAPDTPVDADTPDVVVFNELLSGSAFHALRLRLGHIFPYQSNVIGKDCGTKAGWTTLTGNCQVFLPRGGVSIISRHPIAEVHGLVFNNKAKGTWDQLSNKGAVLAKIMVPDTRHADAEAEDPPEKFSPVRRRPVWVMGTHLQADEGATFGGAIREKQAGEFTAWLDAGIHGTGSGGGGGERLFTISKEDPVIIAGDLNVEFKGKPEAYRKMKELTKIRVNFTSHQSMASVGSFSAASNWLAKADYFSHSAPLDYDDFLDFIGFRRDCKHPVYAPAQMVLPLKAQNAWYWGYMKGWWNLPVKGWTWNNGFYNDISDHYPVMADFYF